MSKPANLEYAFPLKNTGSPSVMSAWRIIGTAFIGVAQELDASLKPGDDYATTPADGDGSVGQYAIFGHPGAGFTVADAMAYYGWNPGDPANHVPTSVRYWELQPGSDVMATTLTGLGPIAITDENVGGVIGDIAYVVSGYVYNDMLNYADAVPIAMQQPSFKGDVAPGHYDAGDIFVVHDPVWGLRPQIAQSSFTVTSLASGYPSTGDYLAYSTPNPLIAAGGGGRYWPYLERYNLKTKTWLPRVPLPSVTTHFDAYSPPVGPAIWAAYVHVPASTLLPGGLYLASADTNPDYTSWSSIDFSTAPGAYGPSHTAPAGDYVLFCSFDPYGPTATLPSGWTLTYPPLNPTRDVVAPYAAEGGIAGVIDGKLYFGGGDGDNITGQEFFVYDPKTEAFTRLPDFPSNYYPDYSAYGVVGGQLWALGYFGNEIYRYTPGGSGWTQLAYTAIGPCDNLTGDQIQGVELGGKLYFVYDRVSVFDPATLTVTAKAALLHGVSASAGAAVIAVNGKIRYYFGAGSPSQSNVQEYDPSSDTWTEVDAAANADLSAGYSVVVAYHDTPYEFSGLYSGTNLPGVYGLTGNAPPLRYESPTHLTHVGLSPRQAQALQSDVTQMSARALIQAGFTPRQAKTLQHGDLSLKALIRGGFTTSQAKVLAS